MNAIDTHTNRRKLAGVAIIILLSFALFAGIYSQTLPSKGVPLAEEGVLDLTEWDFDNKGFVMLDGEWEFHEGMLLTPEDFHNVQKKDITYLEVPGSWQGHTSEGGMERRGYGTYRLKVLVSDPDELYGIKIRSIRMANRLFIDDNVEGGSGLPHHVNAAAKPGNTPYTVIFKPSDNEIEIIIQVSNYVFVTGGIVISIPFGLQEDITTLNGIQLGTDIAAIFVLGMFGAYHVSFYFLGRREKTYLLSGLYLLILVVQKSVYGEKILQQLFPGLPFDIAYKLLDISEFASAAVIIMFFYCIDARLMSVQKLRLTLLPILLYIGAVILLPYRLHIELKYWFFVYIGVAVLAIITRMIYLYSNFRDDTYDRSEQLLFIGGSLSLLVFLVDGGLYAENIVSTDMVGKFGIICFIVFMNILLAVRFAKAYEDSERLSRQLMIAGQLKDEFLTQTSHEIKTPLHGILNITSYLLDDSERNLTAKQKQHLWLVKDTSMKLSMLVNDLIDVTRLRQNELRLQPKAVEVRGTVQIVIDMLQFELAGKTVRLVNEVERDVWVVADENRLRQIVYNLIHNAIRHTDNGMITVSAHISERQTAISVEDTGRGIPLDKHEAIFGYFEQAEEPLPLDGYTGLGVGLYISRKLTEQMGGNIRVAWSEVGRGTRMTFMLPGVEHMQSYMQSASAAELSDPHRFHMDMDELDILEDHERSVLIVDDEASNIHTLLTILRRQPYNVIVAFSAQEALSKLKEHARIDLVILDVMMPHMSGIELCQILRSQYSIIDLPILFATARDTQQDIALGFRAGANDYVTKPFDSETLLARIHTLLAMKTSMQEAIRSELAFHQAQIKPHFLYNALSSVISFCYTDGVKAAYLLSMLSKYLRFILDMDRTVLKVPLHRELELTEAYIEIEKARFGERFDFICYADESIRSVAIPSLCIQPLVENAIRHGLFETDSGGLVTLSIAEGDGYIQVTVEDNGVGMPDDLIYRLSTDKHPQGSIGIANIRKRLEAIQGATFAIDSKLGFGTKVTMFLPIED
ncbi:ATP-binding protein [Paenibacillus sp. YIM B09110]|uniref:ATP-binding protein n=1 Tax=Paenibacillus sp. YIM B09110 TaxID=3126102 RepID=UPI00301C8F2D